MSNSIDSTYLNEGENEFTLNLEQLAIQISPEPEPEQETEEARLLKDNLMKIFLKKLKFGLLVN